MFLGVESDKTSPAVLFFYRLLLLCYNLKCKAGYSISVHRVVYNIIVIML